MVRRVIISGVGQSEWGWRLDDDASRLAITAVRNALSDAGLAGAAVDGLFSYSTVFETAPLTAVASGIGVRELALFGEFPLGGDAIPAAISAASDAIEAGRAHHVVLYRSMKKPPRRPKPTASTPARPRPAPPALSFAQPHGLVAPAIAFGLMADRYLTITGLPIDALEDALAAVVLTQREAAANNPAALLHNEPLDRAGYDASPVYADPLRRADLCVDHEGAAAIVISSPDHVPPVDRPHAHVLATRSAFRPGREPFAFDRPDLHALHHPEEADDLFRRAGVTRNRVRTAQLYDACSFMVLQALEGFGFAPIGSAAAWIAHNGLGPDSELPINTAGGNLAEAYVHGLNGFIEAVRQVRGTSSSSVPDADVAFFGAPTGGAVILGR